MSIETSQGLLEIEEIGSDRNKWVTIESQSVSFNKQDFYIEEFESSFPEYKLIGSNSKEKFKFLTELCARTKVMKLWFSTVTINYSNTTQLPLYLKDSVSPMEYKHVQGKLLEIKSELTKIVEKRNVISAKYTAELEKLEAEEKAVVKKTIGANNILKIVSLTTESLPLSIQMKIQSYTSESEDLDISDNKRRFAQECLAKFKTALIKMDKVSSIEDIDVLIEEISLK
jgi:hypothetical protein